MTSVIPKMLPSYTPLTSVNELSGFVLNRRMSSQAFSEEFGKVQRHYIKEKQRDLFCTEADLLADKLIENNKHSFAGIILSSLCKLTLYIPEQLEKFAWKGYYAAKDTGDVIHMMSRLNDLRNIHVYSGKQDKRSYLKILHKQEKCLSEITNNYDTAVKSYNTIKRKAAPKNTYARMLAHIQLEIGKFIKRRHPEEAREKILSARDIYNQLGYKRDAEDANKLLSEIR